jgi:hypothetical protein
MALLGLVNNDNSYSWFNASNLLQNVKFWMIELALLPGHQQLQIRRVR